MRCSRPRSWCSIPSIRTVSPGFEAFVPNGAKDDRPDARLLLALLVKHRALLHPWHRDDVATRTLNRLVQFRRATVDLRTQLTL